MSSGTLRFRDDAIADEPAVSLDAFFDQPDAVSVRIEAGDDVRRLAPALDRVKLVEVDFPKFRDGRGFSSARVLREMGYTGEIKATGDVLVDLVLFMRRCGFDSYEIPPQVDAAAWLTSLGGISVVYQPATDERASVLTLRHGAAEGRRRGDRPVAPTPTTTTSVG